jgi:hypothetical protein
MKKQLSHHAGIRFVAGFYLVLFAVALFFSGVSGVFSSVPLRSGQSQVVFSAEKDSLGTVGITPVSSPAGEGKTESAPKSENSDDSEYDFDFKFSSVLQWIFGRIVRYIPVPSAQQAGVAAPLWLELCSLRI